MTNPYDTLGVPKDASDAEIKSAFRKKAKKTHPDSGVTPDADAFSRASDAHKLLMDPKRREKFDKTGDTSGSSFSDPIFTKAMELIGNYVMQIMDSENALTMNIPAEIDRALRQASANAEAQVAKLEKLKAKYERAVKKLKRKKTDKEDLLLAVFTSSIGQLAHPLMMANENAASVKKAIDLLDSGSYTFEADMAPPAYAQQYSTTSNMADVLRQMMDDGIMDAARGRRR